MKGKKTNKKIANCCKLEQNMFIIHPYQLSITCLLSNSSSLPSHLFLLHTCWFTSFTHHCPQDHHITRVLTDRLHWSTKLWAIKCECISRMCYCTTRSTGKKNIWTGINLMWVAGQSVQQKTLWLPVNLMRITASLVQQNAHTHHLREGKQDATVYEAGGYIHGKTVALYRCVLLNRAGAKTPETLKGGGLNASESHPKINLRLLFDRLQNKLRIKWWKSKTRS